MYIKVIPDLAKISKKWTKVKEHNFSTYKHEAHKVYANTLRNLLTSEKKLVNMVEQERAEMYPSDTEEEAEEEMYEDEHDVTPDDTAKQASAKNEPESKQITETPKDEPFPVESILKQSTPKKMRQSLLIENGDIPMEMERLENLKRCHEELMNAHQVFIDKAEAYKAAKKKVPFANTPIFIKNHRP